MYPAGSLQEIYIRLEPTVPQDATQTASDEPIAFLIAERKLPPPTSRSCLYTRRMDAPRSFSLRPKFVLNMRVTSILSFLTATAVLAARLDNFEAVIADIDHLKSAGNIVAVPVCQKPVDTSACQEYRSCRCTDKGLDCPFNPARCPESTYNVCLASSTCPVS
jgi:hypothetical protein